MLKKLILSLLISLPIYQISIATDFNYKKAAYIGAGLLGGACIAKFTYDYFFKERSHEEELAYIEKNVQEAQKSCEILSFEYEKFLETLSLNAADRYPALKSCIVSRTCSHPFVSFKQMLDTDIATLQERKELLDDEKNECMKRILTAGKKEEHLNFVPLFKQALASINETLQNLNQLLTDIEIIQRMTMSFNEYFQEQVIKRLEKIEAEVRDLQRLRLHYVPMYVHH
jgi:hypothetical protein